MAVLKKNWIPLRVPIERPTRPKKILRPNSRDPFGGTQIERGAGAQRQCQVVLLRSALTSVNKKPLSSSTLFLRAIEATSNRGCHAPALHCDGYHGGFGLRSLSRRRRAWVPNTPRSALFLWPVPRPP